MASKKDIMQKMKEIGLQKGSAEANKFLLDNGIDIENVELNFTVRDTSKVLWKPKSEFVKIYTKELKKMDNNTITIEMLGFLTLLAPYLNYEDNSLINEDDTYMTQNDIINLTGWSRKKVNQTLKVLIDNEIIYTMKQKDDQRKSKYFINPNVFFKGQKIDRDVKEYFEPKKSKQNN